MKSQIKKRIAAALLLAASFLGHNYKTGAVDHVDSRKFKNNKQSASFPLWAKIVIPVGSLSLLIGINKLRCRPRANISKDDIDKNVDNFINKCENKCKIKEQNKFRQKNCKAGRKKEMLESEYEYLKYPYLIDKDFWFSNILLKKDIEDIEEIINNKKKLAQAEKEKNKETLEYNYQFLIKAGDDRKTSSCVQNLKKLADSFFENYYDKLINNDLTCYEMLESKYKYLKYPYLIDNEGWLLDNFFNNNINGDVEYHEFKDDFLIATEECTNTKYRNKCFGQHRRKLLKQFEYAIKQPYHILSEQSKILGQLFLGKDKIDNSYKCEINDDNSLSVSLKLDNKLETYDVKFNSVKISLDCNNKELKVDWNGKYIYREVEKDVQITSVFDVSEWIK